MSAESPRHARSGGPLTVPSQPPTDRSIIDAVSGFINDVKLTSSTLDPKDVIQWARFETADINEPSPEGDGETEISPLLLILGYGAGVQVWLIPPNGEAQEVLSWRQGTVRVLRILPTPVRGDCFAPKRPLIALCDSASPGPAFCSLSFISIRGGEQVKSIKFKNQILDVLANKRSVVVSFSERFAVFDAGTLEDRMSVTTCYPCPCPLGGSSPINPLALGDRWLAYADKKLNQSKRSSGGCEGEGVSSYTATVLHAAKSLGKGLRGLGETVAHSLAGTRAPAPCPSPPALRSDISQPGVVTVLDVEGIEEEDGQDASDPCEPIVAHFIAHSEPVTALKFDASGMLLVTADKRGHDFHVFRINPHPSSPSLASVHHLYVLHRGDTTAKVQDIAISGDSRWAAISTLRGTTHIFAMSPYGGPCAVRTHTHPRVVNRLSRFHRSAGLPIHATEKRGPASPVGDGSSVGAWFPNPRLPPYPLPVVNAPLAQLRPTPNLATHTVTRTSAGRQRLSSLSEDGSSVPLLARAQWGVAAGAASGSAGGSRGPPQAALYLLTAGGALAHLVLHPRAASSVPKEKICDESAIELEVEPIAQWPLQRPLPAADLLAPLPPSNPLLQPMSCARYADICMSEEERWLSQVEIVTHAGPHRRLWMGPQFVFKTFNCTGSTSSLSEAETVEVEASAGRGVARSNPVNMPGVRPRVPVLIDSGSASSLEHSPSDSFRRKSLLAEAGRVASVCDVQLKEDLAEAMKEDHGLSRERAGVVAEARHGVELAVAPGGTVVRAPASQLPPPSDADDYTCANDDEASFRPVVRSHALPPPADLPATNLPRTTTIPVQSLTVAHSSHLQSDPRPLTTDVVIPVALDEFDADLERQMTDATRDHPLPERPDISVANIVNIPPPVEDSSSFKISVVTAERSRTPESVRDVNAEVEIKEAMVLDDIPPIKTPMESKSKSVSKVVVDDSKQALSLNEFDVLKSFKKPPSLSKKEPSKKESQSKKETPVPLKRDLSPIASKKESSGSMKRDPSLSKESAVSNIGSVITTKKESTAPKKESSASKKESNASSKKESSPPKLESISVSKRESSPSKKESFALSKRDTSPAPLKKESLATAKKESLSSSKKESSLLPSKKESISSSKKETSPMFSKKELVLSLKREPSPSRSRKESHTSSKKESSPSPSRKEPLNLTKNDSFSEMLSFKRDSLDRELSPRKETIESNTLWKKEKFDWSLKNTSEITSSKKEVAEIKVTNVAFKEVVKTEEQAWDMLLNQPEKQELSVSPQSVPSDKGDENKSKSKKNRKLKKSQEDVQSKSEDDSFVEIHAIEEKAQLSCGELVSISMPFEELESSVNLSRTKKSRSPKNIDSKEVEAKLDDWSLDDLRSTFKLKTSKKKSDASNIDILPELDKIMSKERKWEKVADAVEIKSSDVTVVEDIVVKESMYDKKYKSPSNYENRRSVDKDSEVKDVYIIDSTNDEFPEIQITRGSKSRKKSLQNQSEDTDTEKPIKSWSSIAASKNVKQEEKCVEIKTENATKKKDIIEKRVSQSLDDDHALSTGVSLHDELMRLCKRTDIMVAQCDTPSELSFFDEHHSMLQDLPPLELDFNLDDFKLEVIRDSLLEANEGKLSSPICKIDIDNILSSIKESSSTFNLIDLKEVPAKKEKGFSVIESDKITSQEVKVDDDVKVADKDVMERSSDDDNASPVLSTDSDKEDKKSSAINVTTSLSKQSNKSKKSRRKKK